MMGLAAGSTTRCSSSRASGRSGRAGGEGDAIAVTGGTASRAVLFSGLTVVLALLGMLIVPTNIFPSLARARSSWSVSVVAALTLLPALLSLLGDRVNSLRVPFLGRRILDGRAAGGGPGAAWRTGACAGRR